MRKPNQLLRNVDNQKSVLIAFFVRLCLHVPESFMGHVALKELYAIKKEAYGDAVDTHLINLLIPNGMEESFYELLHIKNKEDYIWWAELERSCRRIYEKIPYLAIWIVGMLKGVGEGVRRPLIIGLKYF